ncbi:MAG: DUF6036 family nucleotidyltransferase [Planctomycetota bacterium]|nr:DUF6036 family nucleotidyltransferase [Planctomycetota bacterium]
MSRAVDELWSVARNAARVDAGHLARAVEAAADDSLDYRTRLLIRDSLRALEDHWGAERFREWLFHSPRRTQIECASNPERFDADPNEVGFPSLEKRVVDAILPETINRFLRDLSLRVAHPTRLVIGGSIPLLLFGHMRRTTEDVDVVDEVPPELRAQHQALEELRDLHNLRLTHFQSHYLPAGWDTRLHSMEPFGKLQVFLVDAYDIFVGKLFSMRMKDRQDLHELTSRLDRDQILRRLRDSTAGLRSDAKLLDAAKHNWFVLFGEDLPA